MLVLMSLVLAISRSSRGGRVDLDLAGLARHGIAVLKLRSRSGGYGQFDSGGRVWGAGLG